MTTPMNANKRVTITIEPLDGEPSRTWTFECLESEVATLSDKPVRTLIDEGFQLTPHDHVQFTFKWFRNLQGRKT